MNEFPKSRFAASLSCESGIVSLMDDLGEALTLSRDRLIMMGGGNPAHIPEVQALWRRQMRLLLEESPETFDRMLSDYDQPAGSPAFRDAMAGFLSRKLGWAVSRDNVAITNGGQSAFFFLLNRLAGNMADGSRKRILLPVVPEYIGYCDQSVDGSPLFDARKPRIEKIGEREFKYRIDFDRLALDDTHSAILVSRPTNPSSNVLTDGEIQRLSAMAHERDIPLIIDNAYGFPFPGVIFEEAAPFWDDHIILTMSLSKLGLPGTRTGIVIGSEGIIRDISAMNAIVGLANNNIGQAITLPLIESGEIEEITETMVRPFYRERARLVRELIHELLPRSVPWRFHRSEGAFFIWFWFENLPVPTIELYQMLKERDLIVVPGEYFFYGLSPEDRDWDHARQCMRVSFSQPAETLRKGFTILGKTLEEIY